MNFYSIKSRAEKIDGGFHKLSVFSTSAISLENGGNLDHFMLWNILSMISRKILNVCYFVC